jgi:Tfp pilus assembly protein PilO
MNLLNFSFSPIPRLAAHGLWPLGLLTVLAIGIGIGAYLFVLVPAQQRLTQAEAGYEATRQAQLQQQAARKTQEAFRRTRKDLEQVWEDLPAEKQFAALAVAISELGRAVEVSIPGMTYSLQKVEEGLPARASLAFRAVGEYGAIYRFIHRLETTEPYLFVESLDVSRANDSSRAALTLLVFNVRVVTFLRPDPAKVGES